MSKFEIKYKGRMGPEPDDIKSVKVLNRILTWTKEGLEYESDQSGCLELRNILDESPGLSPPSALFQ